MPNPESVLPTEPGLYEMECESGNRYWLRCHPPDAYRFPVFDVLDKASWFAVGQHLGASEVRPRFRPIRITKCDIVPQQVAP